MRPGCASPRPAAARPWSTESCDAERPPAARSGPRLRARSRRSSCSALADADARDNYAHFLAFREALLAAGTARGRGTLALFPRRGDRPAAALHRPGRRGDRPQRRRRQRRRLFLRAAELLYRPQRIAVQDGRVLAADRETADRLSDPASLDPLGRLLPRSRARLRRPASRS
jgi:hypothetical protein